MMKFILSVILFLSLSLNFLFKTLSSVVIVLLSSFFYPFYMPFFPDQCLIYKQKVFETLSRFFRIYNLLLHFILFYGILKHL